MDNVYEKRIQNLGEGT